MDGRKSTAEDAGPVQQKKQKVVVVMDDPSEEWARSCGTMADVSTLSPFEPAIDPSIRRVNLEKSHVVDEIIESTTNHSHSDDMPMHSKPLSVTGTGAGAGTVNLTVPMQTAEISSSSTSLNLDKQNKAKIITNLCALINGSITQFIVLYGTKYQSDLANDMLQRVKSCQANINGQGTDSSPSPSPSPLIDHFGDLKELYNIAGKVLWLHAVKYAKVHVEGCKLPLDVSLFDIVIRDIEKDEIQIATGTKDAHIKMASGPGPGPVSINAVAVATKNDKFDADTTRTASRDEQRCSLIDFETELLKTIQYSYGLQDYENTFKHDPGFE